MRWQTVGFRVLFVFAIVAMASPAMAQEVDPPTDGGDTGGQTTINPGSAGVVVDARGVLSRNFVPDLDGRTRRQYQAAARQALAPVLTRFSPMRMISLNRLEKAIRDSNGVVTDEMRYLAGLLRLKYVFFYPDSQDIVIAGPAEGWASNPAGRIVGLTTGRPTIQLQDLAVALRAFPPDQSTAQVIGCSIDPTEEGLAAMQQFLRQIGSRATPAQTQFIVNGLRNSLGMQNVSVMGVAPSTHFAQVMVEADYRMKLIGIGLERPPVRMVSFIEKATPSSVSRNALMRWYFVPDYECVRVSEDGLAMELVGDGVKLIGENELVSSSGSRRAAVGTNRASQAFITSFTKRYPALAARSPVYAELRNLIDLVVAAAYIQQEDLYEKAGWKMDILGDEAKFAVHTYNAPKQVASTVAAVWKGRQLMTPIGGGVQIEAQRALFTENLLEDEDGKVAKLRQDTKIELAEGQWWWQ
jgi:uncharacterized protein DUF1598